jgi:hypothetical protein
MALHTSNTEQPVAIPLRKPRRASKNTVVRNFRITYTQDALLDRVSDGHKASAIVRTLLALYFNKKLDALGIENLIAEEIQRTQTAVWKNQEKFKERIPANGKS